MLVDLDRPVRQRADRRPFLEMQPLLLRHAAFRAKADPLDAGDLGEHRQDLLATLQDRRCS